MTIATLRSIPKERRSAVLSSVSSFLLPTHREAREQPSSIERAVLNELARKFGYSGIEVPEQKRSAVQKQLFIELSALLTESKPKDIRARIGQQGLLPNELYDIEFTAQFIDLCVSMGASKSLVESTIRHAEKVEHLFPEQQGIVGITSHSLFVKAHPHVDRCSVLTLAIRAESRLSVEGAWFVFHDVVGGLPTDSPSALLEKFATHYGVDFIVGEMTGKFFLLTEIQNLVGQPIPMFKFVTAVSNFHVDARFSFAISQHGSVKIALAFTIGLAQYLNDLRNNGIRFTRRLETPSKAH